MAALNIGKAFIQASGGVPAADAYFRAWEGFRKLGVPCELFEPGQLGDLPLDRDTLVAGAVSIVESAFKALGITVPLADNLPDCLAKYRGRRVWTSTWGEMRAKYGKSGPPEPFWVKSLRRNKGAPSIAVYSADDFPSASILPDDHEVLVSEYVIFTAEWRCFVCRGQILDLCRYQGDIFRYPEPQVVRGAVTAYEGTGPAGYGIDFGVLVNGQTVLVEVNEGYSLGPYGLESTDYAELLSARWLQLMNPASA